MTSSSAVVVVGRRRRSASTLLAVAHVSSLWTRGNGATPPVRALAILGVESGTLWMLIAGVGTVVEAADVVVLAVVRIVSICPILDPITGALARQLVVTGWCCHL